MSVKYTSTSKIKFTSISEKLDVPKAIKAKQIEMHSCLIEYVVKTFQNNKVYKQRVVDAANLITYSLLMKETLPFDWRTDSPLSTMPQVDHDELERGTGDLYLTVNSIDWDVEPVYITEDTSPIRVIESAKPVPKPIPSSPVILPAKKAAPVPAKATQKEDLYLRCPIHPQFDYNKPWLSMQDGSDRLVIYTTLPEIPVKQNQISITTNVSQMTQSELMRLYPNTIIRTRSPIMYQEVPGCEYDSELGVLFPISGYSTEQVKDNIVRYPHLYKLQRVVGEELRRFYDDIEIEGELVPLLDVWDTLPESSVIPKQSEYMKEYVVRRYLLEEENGVSHRYKMYGTLLPYLTLFMPPEEYISRGYKDTDDIAKQCVLSRVSFKQSRNPILRRLGING